MTADARTAPARLGAARRERRRRGRAVHGWVVIDKPAAMTSTRVVALVRRRLDAAKAGHGGTLDPLATGVLPIALGEATKTVGYVVDSTKGYRFTLRWGEGRDTDDADGAVVETSPVRPTRAAIEAALPAFTGDIMQVPPDYSAVKVGGRRAYELARNDRSVALAARPVRIDRLALVTCADDQTASFEMDCGKGGYVRALARDLAHALGSCAHVVALCRTRVGPFALADAISLAELDRLADSGAAAQWLLPVARGLAGLPALSVNAEQAARLKRGQPIYLVRPPHDAHGAPLAQGTVWATFADRPVAVAEFGGGELHPVRVFNF